METKKSMSPAQLTALYTSVSRVLVNLKSAEKVFQDAVGGEDYSNPFHRVYDMEGVVKKLRDDLVYTVVDLYRKEWCPNVAIDEGDRADLIKAMVKEHGEFGFSAEMAARWVKTEFAEKQTTLSMEQTLTAARKLLPYVKLDPSKEWGGRGPAFDPPQIVKGAALELQAYVYEETKKREYRWTSLKSHDYVAALTALEKLILAVLSKADITKVKGENLSTVLWNGDKGDPNNREAAIDEFMRTEHALPAPMKAMRFYKNGRLVIKFQSEADALKVARVLVAPRGKPE